MGKIDVQTLSIMANILKSPTDMFAIVKGSNGQMSDTTIAPSFPMSMLRMHTSSNK